MQYPRLSPSCRLTTGLMLVTLCASAAQAAVQPWPSGASADLPDTALSLRAADEAVLAGANQLRLSAVDGDVAVLATLADGVDGSAAWPDRSPSADASPLDGAPAGWRALLRHLVRMTQDSIARLSPMMAMLENDAMWVAELHQPEAPAAAPQRTTDTGRTGRH